MSRLAAVVASLLFAACATQSPAPGAAAEGISTLAVVTLLDDDMALLDGERMPLDAVVLRLRFRVRAMDAAQLSSFGVRIVEGADLPASAQARLMASRQRLIDDIDVMEIGYVNLGSEMP